ncbi:tRNA wybutosine-synthesizing protein 4 [Diplonema papillatum]|nr:tRNA wybutosine-synthesizing protein 4 [Diplonema papillatum]
MKKAPAKAPAAGAKKDARPPARTASSGDGRRFSAGVASSAAGSRVPAAVKRRSTLNSSMKTTPETPPLNGPTRGSAGVGKASTGAGKGHGIAQGNAVAASLPAQAHAKPAAAAAAPGRRKSPATSAIAAGRRTTPPAVSLSATPSIRTTAPSPVTTPLSCKGKPVEPRAFNSQTSRDTSEDTAGRGSLKLSATVPSLASPGYSPRLTSPPMGLSKKLSHSSAVSNAAVDEMKTMDDSIQAIGGACELGYFEDTLVHKFIRRPVRQRPHNHVFQYLKARCLMETAEVWLANVRATTEAAAREAAAAASFSAETETADADPSAQSTKSELTSLNGTTGRLPSSTIDTPLDAERPEQQAAKPQQPPHGPDCTSSPPGAVDEVQRAASEEKPESPAYEVNPQHSDAAPAAAAEAAPPTEPAAAGGGEGEEPLVEVEPENAAEEKEEAGEGDPAKRLGSGDAKNRGNNRRIARSFRPSAVDPLIPAQDEDGAPVVRKMSSKESIKQVLSPVQLSTILKPPQIVHFSAGFDTSCLRMARLGVDTYDIDEPDVIFRKTTLLHPGHSAPPGYKGVPLAIENIHDVAAALSAIEKDRPTLFILDRTLSRATPEGGAALLAFIAGFNHRAVLGCGEVGPKDTYGEVMCAAHLKSGRPLKGIYDWASSQAIRAKLNGHKLPPRLHVIVHPGFDVMRHYLLASEERSRVLQIESFSDWEDVIEAVTHAAFFSSVETRLFRNKGIIKQRPGAAQAPPGRRFSTGDSRTTPAGSPAKPKRRLSETPPSPARSTARRASVSPESPVLQRKKSQTPLGAGSPGFRAVSPKSPLAAGKKPPVATSPATAAPVSRLHFMRKLGEIFLGFGHSVVVCASKVQNSKDVAVVLGSDGLVLIDLLFAKRIRGHPPPTGSIPSARTFHKAAMVNEDTMMVFGGCDVTTGCACPNSLFFLNVHTLEWSPTLHPFEDSSTMDASFRSIKRFEETMYTVSEGDEDASTRIATLYNAPTPRWRHAMCSMSPPKAPEPEGVLVFGGLASVLDPDTGKVAHKTLGDTWVFLPVENDWVEVLEEGPAARHSATLSLASNGELVLHGGMSAQYELLNDTWVFNKDAMAWREIVFSSSYVPVPRMSHAASPSERGTLVLGGATATEREGSVSDAEAFLIMFEGSRGVYKPLAVEVPQTGNSMLLVRHSIVLFQPKTFLILGGGAHCLAYGTFLNQARIAYLDTSSTSGKAFATATRNAENIVQLDAPPSFERWKKNIYPKRQPVVFKTTPETVFGPCVERWARPDYLHQLCGDKEVSVSVSESPQLTFHPRNYDFRVMSFSELVKRTVQNENQHEYFYYRSVGANMRKEKANMWQTHAELAADFAVPEFLEKQFDEASCEDGDRAGELCSSVVRASSKDIIMWCHYDITDGVLFQVTGIKHVLLFPPDELPNLYIEGSSSLAGDVTSCDHAQFPLVQKAMKRARAAVLHPGDMLFIPALWFHTTWSQEPSIGLSLAFRHLPERHYDRKDLYCNKDIVEAAAAFKAMEKVHALLEQVPEYYRSFYAKKIVTDLEKLQQPSALPIKAEDLDTDSEEDESERESLNFTDDQWQSSHNLGVFAGTLADIAVRVEDPYASD